MIMVALANRLIQYDRASGMCFWRERDADLFVDGPRQTAASKARRWNAKNAGNPICIRNNIKSLGVRFQLTHAIWMILYGVAPSGVIDHIDGDTTNNTPHNLRDVPLAENTRNRAVPHTNTSGHMGVHWCRRAKRWIARIVVDGQKIEVGRSTDLDEAVAAWKASPLRGRYHKNHGRKRRQLDLSAVGDAPLVADGASGAGADVPSLASAPVFPAQTDSLFHAPEIAR